MIGFYAAGAMGQGGSGGTVYDAIMARSPYWYLRLGDTSGSVASGEVGGRDGSYIAVGTGANDTKLDQPPLYAGGPRSISLGPGTAPRVQVPRTHMDAGVGGLSEFAYMLGVNSRAGSGFRLFSTYGNGGGGASQAWQLRRNNANYEFVKITGGTVTVTAPAFSLPIGSLCLVGINVEDDPISPTTQSILTMYVDGVAVHAASIAKATYTTTGAIGLGIGNYFNSNNNHTDDSYTEAAFFAGPRSAGDFMAVATAMGL